jgi:phenazine biosynthesis protein phzE
MLAHVFSVLGMGSRVVRHEAVLEDPSVLDDVDLVVVGPGPGDRASTTTRRSPPTARRSTRCSSPVRRSSPVCLGHQVLCDRLGIAPCLQGHRLPGDPVVGRDRRAARSASASTTPSSVVPAGTTSRRGQGRVRPETGDIHLVAGPHFRGVQFHAESILTENGFALLRGLLLELLG